MIRIVTIAISLVFLFSACQKSTTEPIDVDNIPEPKMLERGDAAPNFTLKDINNQTVRLSDFKGKVVYIDFWATWCTFCRAAKPKLAEINEKYKDDNFVLIGISTDMQKKDWENYINGHNYNWVQTIDAKQNSLYFVTDYYFVSGIPRGILIDKDGNYYDSIDPRNPNLSQHIDILLQ